MKMSMKIGMMIVVIAMAGVVASLISGCEGKDYSSRPALWDADTAVTDLCIDNNDNDGNGKTDRYGYPAHCSVGKKDNTTGLGTVANIVFTGHYAGATSEDVYTIEIVSGTTSGGATLSWTTKSGTDDGGPVPITQDIPVYIGGSGLVGTFSEKDGQFYLAPGETWKVKVRSWLDNCKMGPDYSCYFPNSISEFACSNQVDDDVDGLIDMEDPECILDCDDGTTASRYVETWVSESFGPNVPECNDGVDNDGDGLIDDQDPQCTSTCDLSEAY